MVFKPNHRVACCEYAIVMIETQHKVNRTIGEKKLESKALRCNASNRLTIGKEKHALFITFRKQHNCLFTGTIVAHPMPAILIGICHGSYEVLPNPCG